MPLLPHKTIVMIGAVVDIALHAGKEPVSAIDLEHRLHLPRRYLEHILQALVRQGILMGVRGPRGGYRLAKARQAISVFDISEAVKTIGTEQPAGEFAGLLDAVVMPALAQAEHAFATALAHISVEDLVQAASLQILGSYQPDAIARAR